MGIPERFTHGTRSSVAFNVIIVTALALLWTCWYGLPMIQSPFKTPSHKISGHHVSVQVGNVSEFTQNYPIDFENATAIFNAVQGALKEKDANLNPVGVSFFPAYIPPNTPMYHSTDKSEIPSLFEWIAMDYEFSYDFASVFGHRRRGGHGGPHGGPHGPPGSHGPPGPPASPRPPMEDVDIAKTEVPGNSSHVSFPRLDRSYLYTFRNKKPLSKLILLDGASAAKTSTGEMDQQKVLSRQRDPYKRVNEREAAAKICKWGEPFGLQGIIRMEIGFEIVLCDFKTDIELISNITLTGERKFGFLDSDEDNESRTQHNENYHDFLQTEAGAMNGWEHLLAGLRTDNGENRILIDWLKFVTPLNRTFIDPDPYKRRINNLPEELEQDIVDELQKHLLGPGSEPFGKTDWQLITEQIVEKFTPMLLSLNGTFAIFEQNARRAKVSDAESVLDGKAVPALGEHVRNMAGNVSRLTFNYARRYTLLDTREKLEKQQYADALEESLKDYVYHTYPLTSHSEALIFSSIYHVFVEISKLVLDVFELGKELVNEYEQDPSIHNLRQNADLAIKMGHRVSRMIDNLKWATFAQCSRKCNLEEICYVPSWGPGPMGWGAPGGNSSQWFQFDGDRFRIGRELQCVSFKDVESR